MLPDVCSGQKSPNATPGDRDAYRRESAELHVAASAAEELTLKVDVSQGAWCGKVRPAAACVPRDVVGHSGRITEEHALGSADGDTADGDGEPVRSVA